MKHAVIDIGSNSMRLTVYTVETGEFDILFREKVMAGLAGYVEKGVLSDKGIQRACDGLRYFRRTLEHLELMDRVTVFATASLRNIRNTIEATQLISAASGFDIQLISGEEEARLGYLGAMQDVSCSYPCGVFADVGGASTEITLFRDGRSAWTESYPIGSLKLYRTCVRRILPGKGSRQRLEKVITREIDQPRLSASIENVIPVGKRPTLVCVGGTARAVLSLAHAMEWVPEKVNTLDISCIEKLYDLFCCGREDRTQLARMILQYEPERIHTLIPGFMVLRYVAHICRAEKMAVSRYGVREGYLCQKLLEKTE